MAMARGFSEGGATCRKPNAAAHAICCLCGTWVPIWLRPGAAARWPKGHVGAKSGQYLPAQCRSDGDHSREGNDSSGEAPRPSARSRITAACGGGVSRHGRG